MNYNVGAVRIGDVEVVKANPQYVGMLKAIIEQNGRILEMNREIAAKLMAPAFIRQTPLNS